MPKSNRDEIILHYAKRKEVASGVWEDVLEQSEPIPVSRQLIYQNRVDKAMLEGYELTARFEIRTHHISQIANELKYVTWRGNRYKVFAINPLMESHHSILELGELI